MFTFLSHLILIFLWMNINWKLLVLVKKNESNSLTSPFFFTKQCFCHYVLSWKGTYSSESMDFLRSWMLLLVDLRDVLSLEGCYCNLLPPPLVSHHRNNEQLWSWECYWSVGTDSTLSLPLWQLMYNWW